MKQLSQTMIDGVSRQTYLDYVHTQVEGGISVRESSSFPNLNAKVITDMANERNVCVSELTSVISHGRKVHLDFLEEWRNQRIF